VLKKKIWAIFQRIIELFTQKIVTKLSKIWIWDPGSGKILFRIPDPGVKKAPDPGPGSATLKKREGEKSFVVKPFFVATNFTKLKIFIFKTLKKKIWASFQRVIELFTRKFVTKL
jgi:hypothetical protein